MNIFIIDGANLIVEKLPIVGSEVEVSTNCDISDTKNFTSSAGTASHFYLSHVCIVSCISVL